MESIREEFHRLIDGIEDEAYLQDLFESVAGLAQQKKDVLDKLSSGEMQRLDNALDQIRTGRIVSGAAMRERYAQWITK